MAILQTGLAQTSGGYQIARSLRFNSADSAYLNRTPASAGNGQKFTISSWVKKSKNDAAQSLYSAFSGAGNTDTTVFHVYMDGGSSTLQITGAVAGVTSTPVFRDVSAWYHVVVSVDTTQSGATNQMKLYINGVQQTVSGTAYTVNTTTPVNQAVVQTIGRRSSVADRYIDGYLTEYYMIDGQALDPTSFGETDATTGVWTPKAYTGTYGTNGFNLKFADNSGTTATTLGKDSSSNGNNWTPNNFSVTAGVGNDSLVDSPTNYGTDTGVGGEVRGNYATLNPLSGLTTGTFSNGNLDFVGVSAGGSLRHSTFGLDSGKWYAEITINSALSAASNLGVSLYGTAAIATTNGTPSRGYYYDGQKFSNGTLSAYGSSFTSGDVIGIAIDIDNGKVWFSKNGTWQNSGSPTGGTNAAFTDITGTTWFPSVQTGGATAGSSCTWNFGQRPFAYTAPSGFKALCATNLSTPAVVKPNTNFDVALYTGTGSSLSISSLGFQPDFTWIKGRSGATNHALYDAVRGVQKDLVSNATSAETTETQGLTAFGSTGFTVGTLAKLNTNTATYAAWNWKANGAGSSNTSGTITSTVSANTTAGISVVTYTAQASGSGTIGHGLGVAPVMIINKPRTGTIDWTVYHVSMGNTAYLRLNTTAAAVTGSAIVWNSTSPTSTVFTQGSAFAALGTMVAYCFAEVAGFSRFGSYTGNGSADGPFVYCGFRPRWIMIKRTDATGDWNMIDTARDVSNVVGVYVYANSSAAEASYSGYDILSNGFKLRNTGANINASGGTYIFMAFAESPFNYARAR